MDSGTLSSRRTDVPCVQKSEAGCETEDVIILGKYRHREAFLDYLLRILSVQLGCQPSWSKHHHAFEKFGGAIKLQRQEYLVVIEYL